MSISSEHLEAIRNNLHDLATRLKADRREPTTELTDHDALVIEARQCDFMLPSPLTIESLSETVARKIENVGVLLDRAEMHESLPPEARKAAEEENAYMVEDYQDDPALPGAADSQPPTSRR